MKTKAHESVTALKEWKVAEWISQIDSDPDLEKLINGLPRHEQVIFYESIILNPYIPNVPFYTQTKLLTSCWDEEFAFYGGGRGGGKTDTLLMGGVQFAQIPTWKAGILRLTHKHLNRLGAVLDRAKKWFNLPYLKNEGLTPHGPGDALIYTFPSGAGLMFGHVQYDSDVEIYQGAELHRLLIDEAVQFSTYKITGLKGSVRRLEGDPLPTNVWYTGNPGGISHEYFNNNFVVGSQLFISSLYTDNPYLDHDQYGGFLNSIADENPILGRQWKYGDWNATPKGKMFKREWFRHTYTGAPPSRIVKRVRLWDLAATDPEDPLNKNPDPDWTAGALLLLGEDGRVYLDNMRHFQKSPDEAEPEMFDQAREDSVNVKFRFELEGGASPKYLLNTWTKSLPGFDVDGWQVPRKDKIIRAQAMVSTIKHGHLWLREDPEWNDEFLAEITSFPTKGVHDDQVDALSGAYAILFNLKTSDYDPPNWEDFEELNS